MLPIVLEKSAWNPEAVLLLPVKLPVWVGLMIKCVRVDEPAAVFPKPSLATELHAGAAHIGVCACTQLELSSRTAAKDQ